MRQIARTDNNQAEIVEALRKLGADVLDLHAVGHGVPDLLIAYRYRNMLVEVKSDNGKLTPDEKQFFHTWRGPKAIVSSVADAITLLEVLEDNDE